MTDIVAEPTLAVPPFSINLSKERVEFSGMNSLLIDSAEVFGVHLQAHEIEDWLTMFRAAYVIDEYLDEAKTDIMPRIAAMLSGESIPGVPDALQEQCRSFMERQSENRRLEVIKTLGQVSALVGEHAAAESVQELIRIRRQEANLFADLLSLPTDYRPDQAARESFNSWLTVFSQSGYIVDSLMDLKADYTNGSSKVRPTIRAKTILAAAVAKDTYSAVRQTPNQVLGKCALVAVKNQILRKKPDFTDPDQLI